ncbi:MAG: heparinase II/III family protein, partial [Candidatus Latescibacteria bacterium]|nr:heparinase II/III family protein [Candidatus Latescibacterota bacterium]
MPIIGDTRYDTEANLLSAEILAVRLGGAYAGFLELIQGAPLSEKGQEYALWYRPYNLRAESTVLPLHTEWFPGWHVGVLRGGRNDTALYLNGNEHRWTLQTGHRQQDILSLSYYAYGEELASDRGYFSGSSQQLPDGRSGQVWVKSSLSHNLVVVDEKEQNNTACGSNLELFGTAPGIEIVQASGVNVYPQCEEYRRTCAMVTT